MQAKLNFATVKEITKDGTYVIYNDSEIMSSLPLYRVDSYVPALDDVVVVMNKKVILGKVVI